MRTYTAVIAKVSANDVIGYLNLSPDEAQLINQEFIDELADRMGDDYLQQLFYSSLNIIAVNMLKERKQKVQE